jgi:hypothetical protein
VFAYDLSDHSDIAKRRNVFVGQVNNLLCQLSALDSFTLSKLFNSFCRSFYGCELWDLQAPALNDFCVAWHIALRHIWRLQRTSHSRLLLIADCMPLLTCICRRFIWFADSCVNSESLLVSFVACHGINTAWMSSVIGRNIYFCAERYCSSPEDLLAASQNYNNFFQLVYPQTNLADIICVMCVLELIFVHDGFFYNG